MCCRAIKTKLMGVTEIAYQCCLSNRRKIKKCPWLETFLPNGVVKPLSFDVRVDLHGIRVGPVRSGRRNWSC